MRGGAAPGVRPLRPVAAAVGLLAAVLLAGVSPVVAQERDERGRDACSGRAERCGAGVIIDRGLRGVDNCTLDPNCRTRRIVDNDDPRRGTDFIPVPDWPGAGGGTGPDSGGGAGAGADDAGAGAGDAGAGAGDGGQGADEAAAAPRCTPRAAGRVGPDFSQVRLPRGRIGANPLHAHLTGLESWFWYEGARTVQWPSPVYVGITADCEIVPAPPPLTYRADLVALTWDVADSRPTTVRTEEPGSAAEPAVRHRYETKGDWPVTVTCTWRGSWGGHAPVPCAQRDLEVVEVRGRLQP